MQGASLFISFKTCYNLSMENLEQTLKKYDYSFPKELIAQKPVSPRDGARLLVFNKKTKKTFLDTFKNLGAYLPKDAVLVFNHTTVVPARLVITKPSGGLARLLYINHKNDLITVLSDRKLKIGDELTLSKKIKFKVSSQKNNFYILKPLFISSQITKVLKQRGITPLPPYIKHSPLSEKELRKQYQTVFAKTGLSVAAPTASLHFTKTLLQNLKKLGFDSCFINLNVGLGTFAPLKQENLEKSRLHEEFFEIDKKTAVFLNQAKAQGRPIIAVGTTAVRTLESSCKNSKIRMLSGNTDLFIKEGYEFNFVDGIITNFHVPKSSLLMLVSAFAGRNNILRLYKQAIDKKFRLFSFGDGMVIL